MSHTDIDVVVLNYRTPHLATEAAKSAHANGAERIFVLDNCSGDRSIEYLNKNVSDFCEVIFLENNVGYSKAMNYGASLGSSPFILFSNADIRFKQGSIKDMINAFSENKSIGAVGPSLIYPDGRFQASAYLFITPMRVMKQMLGIDKVANYIKCRLLAGSEDPTKNSDYTGIVESLYGACFCVRRTAFESVNGFDENFFLYCEETDLFKRLAEDGWLIVRQADAKVIHKHRQSANESDFNTLVTLQESRWIYSKKHFDIYGQWIVAVSSIFGLFFRYFLSKNQKLKTTYFDALKWWLGDH